jgi:hypothetical protein
MPINSFLAQVASRPIKLEGFDISPSSSNNHHNSIPHNEVSNHLDQHGFIDPAILFGFEQHSTSNFDQHKSGGIGMGGGNSAFSDLDLDFEHTLASLIPNTPAISSHHQPQSNQNQHQLYELNGDGGYSNGWINQMRPSSGGIIPGGGTSQTGHRYTDSNASNHHTPAHYYSPAASVLSPNTNFSTSPRESTRSPSAPIHELYSASPADFGSYSSVRSEVRPSLARSTSKRRSSPVPAGTERSRSSAVGKAPNSSTRSRSVRRASSSSGNYAPASSSTVKITSTGSQPLSMHHGSSAIIIPSPSTSVPHHSIASMSMPVYSTNSTTNGIGIDQTVDKSNAGSWYGSSGNLGGVGSPASVVTSRSMARSASTERGPMDSASGWRPSAPGSIILSSAPTLGASKKLGKGLDDVPEDPLSKQYVLFSSRLLHLSDLIRLGLHRAIALDKKQKRRESHNAVERRRRDNINDRITELAALLPECLLDQAVAGDDNPTSPSGASIALASTSPATLNMSSMSLSGSAAAAATTASIASTAAKANKGMILSKSVDYIRYLQQLVELHSSRNAELERTVDQLRRSMGSSDTPSSNNSDDRSPRELHVSEHLGAPINDPSFNERFLISASKGEFGKGAAKWGFRNSESNEDDDMDG